jgi:formylmethanofuran dehydrogenase subunit B
MSAPTVGTGRWTCPFCPLLCDGLTLTPGTAGAAPTLGGTDCPRARDRLADLAPATAPRIDGRPCSLDSALDAAAGALRASRQALVAGLGADVATARALHRLAHDSGAICDALNGDAMFEGLRALQDRGGFTTTLAEVRNHADLIVCVGGSPLPRLPEFFRRCGLGEDLVESRHVVLLGGHARDLDDLAGLRGVTGEVVATPGDLFDTARGLAAAVAGRPAPAPLQALAERLRSARYAVLVWEGGRLPRHGALIVEMLDRAVAQLNRSTRAAALPLGGGDGAATSNQVQAWLSGLPLRSRVTPGGLEHEPVRFGTQRLLDTGAVDLLLWLQLFDAHAVPPPCAGLPRIVIGPAAMGDRLPAGSGSPDVFIPVATPGLGHGGHLFRADGVVLMPLHPAFDQGLPTAAEVLTGLLARLAGAPVRPVELAAS